MLVSVVYDSGYGHTAKQAQAVAERIGKVPGAEAKLINVSNGPIPWESLQTSDAIVFGSSTYNGTLSAKLKQFFEDTTKPVWRELKWRNKIAAAFTNSGTQSLCLVSAWRGGNATAKTTSNGVERSLSLVTVSALIASGQVAQITYYVNRTMDNRLTKNQAAGSSHARQFVRIGRAIQEQPSVKPIEGLERGERGAMPK